MRKAYLIGFALLVSACDGEHGGNQTGSSSAVASTEVGLGNWTYGSVDDALHGTSTKYATTESKETFENSFGADSTPTRLEVQRQAGKQQVSLSNPNLQYTCSAYTSTHIYAKFDNGGATRFECTEESTSKYGVAFILPASRFVQKLRHAKTLIIGTDVFQRGEVEQTFQVSGMKW